MPKKPRQGELAANGSEASLMRKVDIRLQEPPDLEVQFVNHAIANFNGTEFILTLAQAIPPSDRQGEAWQNLLESGVLKARIVSQTAMPVDKFVEMTEAFASLIAGLRDAGLISRSAQSDAS